MQRQNAIDAGAASATVRELVESPILDAFEARHRDAVRQVLAERPSFVLRCIVLDASRPEEQSGTATLRLLCRETNAAHGMRNGEVIEVYHSPAAELEALHIDTGYGELRPGETRAFLLQGRWWKTFLRVPGKVVGTLDFVAMRQACDWPEARQFIGDGQHSVLEGILTHADRHPRAPAVFDYSSLTIARVLWSPADWKGGEVRRLARFGPDVMSVVGEEHIPLEVRLGADPPHGVPLTVVVEHGVFTEDLLVSARVRQE